MFRNEFIADTWIDEISGSPRGEFGGDVFWVAVPCDLVDVYRRLFIALIMEAGNTSESSVKLYQTTRHQQHKRQASSDTCIVGCLTTMYQPLLLSASELYERVGFDELVGIRWVAFASNVEGLVRFRQTFGYVLWCYGGHNLKRCYRIRASTFHHNGNSLQFSD